MKPFKTPLAILAGLFALAEMAQTNMTQSEIAGGQQPATSSKTSNPEQKPGATETQKTPPSDEAKKDEESEPKKHYNSLAVEYKTWNSTGYLNGIHQNGYVHGGFALSKLSILEPYRHGRYYAFDLIGNPGEDYGTRILGQWGANDTLIATSHQFTFFDPRFGSLEPSQDKEWDATFIHQLAPNFAAYANYRFEQNERHFPAPNVQPNYINRTIVLGSSKQVGDTTLSGTLTETRFSDLSLYQPITLSDRGELLYLGSWGPRLSTQANIGSTRIQQQGRPDSWVRDYGFSGVYDLNGSSAFGGHVGQTVLDLNSVQNAYVRKRLDTGLTYDYRVGTWGLDLGFQHREEERVRADHSYVDVPKWNNYSFKLNGRLPEGYRLGLKGSFDELTSAPVFLTDDPTLLYWEHKATVQAKLSAGSAHESGYLSYTYRGRRNDERGQHINWHNVAMGGSLVFSPKLLGYAEFASDQYHVDGTSATAAQLGTYFPTSETFMLGLDITRNARENLSAVLTSFLTQDQWGQQIALTYHLDLGKERNIQITYSPWLQRDRLYDVDSFDARILSVKVGTRF